MKKSVKILALVVILSLGAFSVCACHKEDGEEDAKQTSWYIESKAKDAADNEGNKPIGEQTDIEASATPAGSSDKSSQDSGSAGTGKSENASDGSKASGNTAASESPSEKTDTSANAEGSSHAASENTEAKAGTKTGDTSDNKQDKEPKDNTKTETHSNGSDEAQDTEGETTADASSLSSDEPASGTETAEDPEEGENAQTETFDNTDDPEETEGSDIETPDDTQDASQDDPSVDEQEVPAPDQAELREQAWQTSLLVWIPEYTGGTFVGISAADTYDYAVFEEVTDKKSVDKFVQNLITAGFDDDPETGSTSQNTWFKAGNAQGWQVSVEYNKHTGILKIGSGYDESYDTDNDDRLNKIWSTTSLSLLPISEEGILESYLSGQDSFAVLSSFSQKYAEEYVEAIKRNGFIYDVDEGESDGVMWYIAEDTDGNCAAFVYSEGVAKIMCSRAEY